MPDGDILRLGILPQYCTAYQQMCEGVAPDDCARALAKGLRNRIQWYGPGPRDLLKRMATEFSSLLHQVDPIQSFQLAQLDRAISRERRQFNGQPEGLNIVSDVCKSTLYMLQQGDIPRDLSLHLSTLFVNQVLECSFDARVGAVRNHFDGVSPEIIHSRRQEINNHLGRYMDYFARQIVQTDSSKKLRLARTLRPKATATLDDVVE